MSESRVVTAPVQRVTVFEDRAQIRRTARVELAAGAHCLVVERVSPLCVDRTLRGAVKGPLQLRQVRMRRESTVRASHPELERELGEEIERLIEEYLAIYDQQLAREAEQRLLERSFSDWLQACSMEAGRGQVSRQADWGAGLRRLEERLQAVADEVRQSQAKAEDLAEQLEQLGERRFLAMQPTSFYWGCLEAVADVAAGGGPCEVSWDYLVPCALWRPVHRAELSQELQWTMGGMIWQRTGEDWDGVQLCLSTGRPTAGAKMPILDEDVLRLRQKTDTEQSAVAVESRDEEIAMLAPSAPGSTSLRVPGVDDGGEVRRFEPAVPVSIPSDGRAHLIELGSFSSAVTLDRVSYPELAGQVQLRSRQTNTSNQPVLAGPVTLIHQGGFSGRSVCTFVGPGEAFELGWGPEEGLHVVRRVDEKEEELALGRGLRRRTRVRLYLSNTGNQPQHLQVIERTPVSEVSAVRVKLVENETSAGSRTDSNGHLSWELELAPSSHRELTLVYDIESSRHVVWS